MTQNFNRPFGSHVSLPHDLLAQLVSLHSVGYGAAQIFLGPPQQPFTLKSFSQLQKSQISDWLHETKFKLYVHAPYTAHAIAKPESVVKNNKAIQKAIHLAAELGCSGYVVHMGGTKWYEVEGSKPYHEVLYTLCSEIGKTALDICPLLLENCASGNLMSGSLPTIGSLITEVRTFGFNVGMCLDTLHAFAWGESMLPWDGELDPLFGEAGLYQFLHDKVQLFHLNSGPEKVFFGGHLDRHECIKAGVIKEEFFEILLSMHPECPVIVERDEMQKVIWDFDFVRACDQRREARKNQLLTETTTDLKAREEQLIREGFISR